ncbi:aromatase/cyclase [Actinophytocola sp.]|uniref:aromatase/cyclase n=1 Tax=Actinophytocola sp. TaxID=1872138 RepID=UPI00389A9B3F
MLKHNLPKVEHDIVVRASAEDVYRLVADVANWPRIFPPTVHVEHLERGDDEERIRIWATANGEAKTWVSRRVLDPDRLRIDFRQEVSSPPVAAMGGSWVVEPMNDGECRVRLLHDYRAVDDDPQALKWIERAVDGNSRAELNALRAGAELADGSADLLMSFQDSLWIDGPAERVYDFIDQAGLWADRLPHVARVDLTEPAEGLQVLEMDTKAKDGSTHTTKSVRVCFPKRRIVYKQTTLPALLSLHTGRWTFEDSEGGVLATSQHTVVLRPENIAKVLGEGAGVDRARAYVRDALGTNSKATLGHAKQYAESEG